MSIGAPNRRSRPELSVIVVHWRHEDAVEALARDWPRDPRFELVVIDNGGERALDLTPDTVVVSPGFNVGFAGGVNAGVKAAGADLLLMLNADATPEPGALSALLEGFERHPDAAGLAPRLVGTAGETQHRWQLQPLPTAFDLVLQTLFIGPRRGPREEPAPSSRVEQPAAAALALRRSVLERLGGLDPRFWPAWFEDVDLARRLHEIAEKIRYWPAAIVRHRGGVSVAALGYGAFLRAYYGNLLRYVRRHHGRREAVVVRTTLIVGSLARIALLPLRRPRRAASRIEAAGALVRLASGVALGRELAPRRDL